MVAITERSVWAGGVFQRNLWQSKAEVIKLWQIPDLSFLRISGKVFSAFKVLSPGGIQQSFIKGSLLREVQPLTLLNTTFDKKKKVSLSDTFHWASAID